MLLKKVNGTSYFFLKKKKKKKKTNYIKIYLLNKHHFNDIFQFPFMNYFSII